ASPWPALVQDAAARPRAIRSRHRGHDCFPLAPRLPALQAESRIPAEVFSPEVRRGRPARAVASVDYNQAPVDYRQGLCLFVGEEDVASWGYTDALTF
ncbi:MAG: hypothetical protein ACK4RK_05775, partial [Gemmataceae bacterium]